MTKPLEQLALRKALLQTDSVLYRRKILQELHAVRASLDWRQEGMKAATSLPARPILFSLALRCLGHGRLARLLAVAGRVMLLAKVTSIAANILRKPPASPL